MEPVDVKGGRVGETSFQVRYAETDQMGVVHHAAYLVWFEVGRATWLRELGRDYAEFEAEGRYLSVAEVTARYVLPARYGRPVTVRTRCREVRSRSVRFEYEVFDPDGRLLATGGTRHICVDRQGRVSAIPTQWRDLLALAVAPG